MRSVSVARGVLSLPFFLFFKSDAFGIAVFLAPSAFLSLISSFFGGGFENR